MPSARILLVDDEHDLLIALARQFKAAGYTVVTARDGESALKEVEEARPAAIVSDVNMPGMNGYQLCRKLSSQPDTSDIPVLLMSGKTGPADSYWAKETGAVDLMRKPVDVRALLALVDQVLQP